MSRRPIFLSRFRAVPLAAAFLAFVIASLLPANGTTASAADSGAQAPAATVSAAKSPGPLNEWLRKQSEVMRVWDIGGEFRLRYAVSEGAVPADSCMTGVSAGARPLTLPVNPNTDFIAHGRPNNNDELLLREKFHVGYTPVSWFTVYGEFRDSSESWDRRHPSPDEDTCDLRQAHVAFGDPDLFPLMAKFGRQQLNYGDLRFVADSRWGNNGRTFDAAKLRWVTEAFWVDAFCGRMVAPRQDHFNVSNDYDWFSGIYASSRALLPWQETQLYFLARNATSNAVSAVDTNVPGTPATARDIYTTGLRFKSLPGQLDGWDYTVEAAGQFGSIYNATLRKRLDQQAYAVFGSGGYTWTNVWATPRLGVGYEGGSGDSNSTDGRNETFENLFGSSHGFYGVMDLFCQRNMHIPRVSASLRPLKGLSLAADCLWFVLADTHDSLYPESGGGRNQNGYGIHPSFDSFVGTEVDLLAAYTFKTWLKLEAGYGHFFVGDYIEQSVKSVAANRGATDADWCYVQTTISF